MRSWNKTLTSSYDQSSKPKSVTQAFVSSPNRCLQQESLSTLFSNWWSYIMPFLNKVLVSSDPILFLLPFIISDILMSKNLKMFNGRDKVKLAWLDEQAEVSISAVNVQQCGALVDGHRPRALSRTPFSRLPLTFPNSQSVDARWSMYLQRQRQKSTSLLYNTPYSLWFLLAFKHTQNSLTNPTFSPSLNDQHSVNLVSSTPISPPMNFKVNSRHFIYT